MSLSIPLLLFVQALSFQLETLSKSKAYTRLLELSGEPSSDDAILIYWRVDDGSKIIMVVYLHKERPLSEPKWIKTGDIQDWLKDMFGGRFWVAGDAVGWEKKIEVCYPDPVCL